MNMNLLPRLTQLLSITHISLHRAMIYGPSTSELYVRLYIQTARTFPFSRRFTYADMRLDLAGKAVINAQCSSKDKIQQEVWEEVQRRLSSMELHIYLNALAKVILNYLNDMDVLRFKGNMMGDGDVILKLV